MKVRSIVRYARSIVLREESFLTSIGSLLVLFIPRENDMHLLQRLLAGHDSASSQWGIGVAVCVAVPPITRRTYLSEALFLGH